ncbi:MAG: hypothetical protein ACREO3_02105 [Arenimonas sp.]
MFVDIDQGAPTQERLLMAIAESMPAAQTLTVVRPDGHVAPVVYAGDRDSTSLRN